jgi:L-fuconolactonase
MIRVDAHQHFWNPARGDYDWMPKDNPILARAYAPNDLGPLLEAEGISYTVLVQAAATVEETEYMLGLADATDSIAGVVGWIDFEQEAHRRHLERLAAHPKFKGVRPMIQDIEDVDWMLRPSLGWAYEALIDLDLTFDALGFPRHLENFAQLLARYPKLRTVIDHCMKPDIAAGGEDGFQVWAEGMARLANETQAFCKLSGLVTEAQETWSVDDLRPYADHVLGAFGAARVMWGSDWPVCRLRAEYTDWVKAAKDLTASLSDAERAHVFGGTAAAFYRLGV